MWLPDLIDSRGVRITVRVEPAVGKWTRIWHRWTVPAVVLAWSDTLRRALQRGVQENVLGGRWAVDVEADDGISLRVVVPTRGEALALGQKIRAEVAATGVQALDAYR